MSLRQDGYEITEEPILWYSLKNFRREVSKLLDICLGLEENTLPIDFKYNLLAKTSPDLKSRFYEVLKKDLCVLNLVHSVANLVVPDMSTPWIVDSQQIRIDTKDSQYDLPWHQEKPGTLADDSYVVWTPLTKADVEHGTIKIIPGSHKRGLQPHTFYGNYHGLVEQPAETEAIVLDVPAGHSVIFHSLLYHATVPNPSNQIRWTLNFRLNNAATMPYLLGTSDSLDIKKKDDIYVD